LRQQTTSCRSETQTSYGALVVRSLLSLGCMYTKLTAVLDYLVSSHHGRGIMSAAVGTLIDSWMVPRMNARLIRVEVFSGNMGSRRVFEKNGFVFEKRVDYPAVLACGETRLGYDVLWWRSGQ
jgi:RimJ/RimL family protein N-acetyltransferase